ncbi:alpha/beta hydrolase [Photobacterium sp. GJ3]|uniref:alpha/beta family hydrolase n=1 Tax=Photobacterium sp. GJ3 TaxID=2829502 RepID=UPI001B8B0C29|nr:alpha/beta family hydrolase [Photobacterium sp. GJ3]QUJ66927.1 alpha/beta hydrolase [Photobacterium sp. GJ3]
MEYRIDTPENGQFDATFLFAHGAGAGMDHEFMTAIAQGLTAKGIRVVRFDFPYMVQRREDGKKRPPDRQPKLLLDFQRHLMRFAEEGPLVIGGKSMGGRMASLLVTDEAESAPEVSNCQAWVQGVACLGFPFHPPGKPENFRGDHLKTIAVPTLILQGERDTFGTRSEVEGWTYADTVRLAFVPDGDHSFKPRKASGHTEAGNRQLAVALLADFINQCVSPV